MAGLRRGEGPRRRILIAHLAHEDDVRVLAQAVADPLLEAVHVAPQLTLADDALLTAQTVLDGVFQRDDATGPVPRDAIYERGDGGGLARTRDAGQQYQPVLHVDDVLPDVVGEPDLLDRRYVHLQRSDGRGDPIAVVEEVEPELERLRRVGAVERQVGTQAAQFLTGEQRGGVRLHGAPIQRRAVDLLQKTVDAVYGWLTHLQVQVRDPQSTGLPEIVQQFPDCGVSRHDPWRARYLLCAAFGHGRSLHHSHGPSEVMVLHAARTSFFAAAPPSSAGKP